MNWFADPRNIVVALLLVGLKGLLVAAELALVKVRSSRRDVLGGNGSLAGRVARWEAEAVENFREPMDAIDPNVKITSGQLSEALERSYVRLHRALWKAAELGKLRHRQLVRLAKPRPFPLQKL